MSETTTILDNLAAVAARGLPMASDEVEAVASAVATLRERLAEVERERDAARDKNVELHNRVRTLKNRAVKLGQKQKKNHKLAVYADRDNAVLRAEADRLRATVEAARAYIDGDPNDPWGYGDDDRHAALREAVRDYVDARSRDGGDDAQR